MIVWRLKRGELEYELVFGAFFDKGSNLWRVYKQTDVSVWKAAFGVISSNNIVTFNGFSFIASERLSPEVISGSDGHFDYYLSKDGIRVSEIPLQSSANELTLEITERSKIAISRNIC